MISSLTAVHSPRNSIGDTSKICGSAPDTENERKSRSDSGYGDGDDSISLVNKEDGHYTGGPLPTKTLSIPALCTTCLGKSVAIVPAEKIVHILYKSLEILEPMQYDDSKIVDIDSISTFTDALWKVILGSNPSRKLV
ncbi:hypothetical protein MMC14_007134 [Varicellaria rhodocarpa]|nr:hypothetical protein [Varicellaria rhodocarpa]